MKKITQKQYVMNCINHARYRYAMALVDNYRRLANVCAEAYDFDEEYIIEYKIKSAKEYIREVDSIEIIDLKTFVSRNKEKVYIFSKEYEELRKVDLLMDTTFNEREEKKKLSEAKQEVIKEILEIIEKNKTFIKPKAKKKWWQILD